MLQLKVVHEDAVLALAEGENEVALFYPGTYNEGDTLVLESDAGFLVATMETGLGPVLVYSNGTPFTLPIPFGARRICYDPRCFTGEGHYLYARKAAASETEGKRLLSYNPLDCHKNSALFPHAYANVETRGEASFEARNAIDGLFANNNHGHWPWSSWGINRDPKAELTIDFGREVVVEDIVIHLRADFPHDAWWKQATITSPAGSCVLPLEKLATAQKFSVGPWKTRTVTLKDLIKADDPSEFPALTQIAVWGREC